MRKGIILFILLLLMFVYVAELYGQQTNQSLLKNESKILSADELQFLRNEIKNYRDFIQQERKQHQEFLESFYNRTFSLFSMIGGIIVVLVTIFVGTSIWQIKKTVHRLFERYTIELITEKSEPLKISIDRLNGVISRETSYLNKKLVFLCSANDRSKLEGRELPMIFARGIKSENLEIVHQLENVSQAIDTQTIDLMLYYYNPNDQKTDPLLHKVIERLRKANRPIPIIIYNYDKLNERGQLFGNDSAVMRSYPYHLAANFPITFVNHIYTTINYFSI